MSEQIINEIFLPCLSTVLIGLTTVFMTVVKKKINQVANTQEKKEIVESVVTSVEYLYTKLDIHNKSKEKLALAKRDIIKLLNDRNIKISEHELDILINSCLHKIETETLTTIDELRGDIYEKKENDFHFINNAKCTNYSYTNVKPKNEYCNNDNNNFNGYL